VLVAGQIVHYSLEGLPGRSQEHVPAMITQVRNHMTGLVDLQVHPDNGQTVQKKLRRYSEQLTPGTWHWIEPA
jgi:hypothetical protein